MSRKFLIAIGVSVLALTSCGLGSSSSDGSYSYSGGGVAEPGAVGAPDYNEDGSKVESGSAIATPAIIRTGDMSLETKDLDKTFAAVQDLVKAAGGSIDNSNTYRDNYYDFTGASITARVPAEKLDEVIDEISTLGDRTSLSLNTTDVTLTKVDLEARIASLQASVTRLQELMAQATTTADLLAAETALAQRQGELDSLQSQLEYLESQVAMSTLTINLSEPQNSITSGLRGFSKTLIESARRFVSGFEEVVIFIGAFLPWVIVVGGIGLGGRAARRTWTNRKPRS